MNVVLLQRCDLRDTCAVHLPIVFSKIRVHQQYRHVWSCFFPKLRQVSPRQFIGILQSIAAGIGTCTFYERFPWCAYSSSSGSMKMIPRCCLALSSFGFSITHFCFALLFAASDICFHISGHTLSGLEVVCFLVSLSQDHVYPSGGLFVQ